MPRMRPTQWSCSVWRCSNVFPFLCDCQNLGNKKTAVFIDFLSLRNTADIMFLSDIGEKHCPLMPSSEYHCNMRFYGSSREMSQDCYISNVCNKSFPFLRQSSHSAAFDRASSFHNSFFCVIFSNFFSIL